MSISFPARSAAELLGVPDKPKNARDRLLDTAIDLFYANGFHTIGLDAILDKTGVTKTTFYKHFESKEDLVVEALRRRDAWEMQAWARAIQKIAGDDPRRSLLAVFDVLDVWFNDPAFGGFPGPEIDDGPHFFYALQWFFFAVLALGGLVYFSRQEVRGDSSRTGPTEPSRAEARAGAAD